MPKTYIFDAVHTILKPVPDVMSCYFLAGKRHGSSLTKDDVKSRFREGRRVHFGTSNSAAETDRGSLMSSDEIEFQLWKNLVTHVFADVPEITPLFQELWDHFASPANWELYDDVASCWSSLAAGNDRIVIASNFDSRLYEIVKQHPALAVVDSVFCSADVGYRKPDPMFYETVSKSLSLTDNEEVIMVGDDFENDYAAPQMFGWKAFHLDRRHGVAPKEGMISSLSQLLLTGDVA